MMVKYVLIGFGVSILVSLLLILTPVPIVKESQAITVSGEVTAIHGNKTKDIFIYLKDVNTRFYINRGIEEGLSVDELVDRLEGEKVVLKYPKYWTPLDWNNRIKHISKLEFNDEVIFNELKQG